MATVFVTVCGAGDVTFATVCGVGCGAGAVGLVTVCGVGCGAGVATLDAASVGAWEVDGFDCGTGEAAGAGGVVEGELTFVAACCVEAGACVAAWAADDVVVEAVGVGATPVREVPSA